MFIYILFIFILFCYIGAGAGAPPPPPPGGMPPPPPVMPEGDFQNLSVDDRSALFAQINQGEGITGSKYRCHLFIAHYRKPSPRVSKILVFRSPHLPAVIG